MRGKIKLSEYNMHRLIKECARKLLHEAEGDKFEDYNGEKEYDWEDKVKGSPLTEEMMQKYHKEIRKL